jgi:hypothetical protein
LPTQYLIIAQREAAVAVVEEMTGMMVMMVVAEAPAPLQAPMRVVRQ